MWAIVVGVMLLLVLAWCFHDSGGLDYRGREAAGALSDRESRTSREFHARVRRTRRREHARRPVSNH